MDKLREQLQSFDTVVLITQGVDAAGRARPMAVARVEETCDLWLFAAEDAARVKDTEAASEAQVICQQGWTGCVIITGRAAVIRDRGMIRELWKTGFKVWFHKGAEDPNLVLFHFVGERAEYWDSTGANSFTYIYPELSVVQQGTSPGR